MGFGMVMLLFGFVIGAVVENNANSMVTGYRLQVTGDNNMPQATIRDSDYICECVNCTQCWFSADRHAKFCPKCMDASEIIYQAWRDKLNNALLEDE